MACEHLCANGNYVGLGEGFSFPNEAWYSSFKLIMHTVLIYQSCFILASQITQFKFLLPLL